MDHVFQWLDFFGVAVFATSGALVASRKQMDVFGFALVGTVTGIGGGTLRDLVLDRPVFWVGQPAYVVLCLVVSALLFVIAPHIARRFPVLLWSDAVGLAVFSVAGAEIALEAGASWPVAVVMGMMTATFGGLLRDVLCNEVPLILRREIYATAAALGALVHVAASTAGLAAPGPAVAGMVACFALRALALHYRLTLPAYRPRPGRDYPLD